jgi:flagellar motor protein MotB
LSLVLLACGGSRASEPLTAASRLSTSPGATRARSLAPEEYREARAALTAAKRAQGDGRDAEADRLALEAGVLFEVAIAAAQANGARARIAESERAAQEGERERDQNNAARRAEESRIAALVKQQEIDRILVEERIRAEEDERGRPRTGAEEARDRAQRARRAAEEMLVRARVVLIAAEVLFGASADQDAAVAAARRAVAEAEGAASADPAAAFTAAGAARAKADDALSAARRAAADRAGQARLRAEDAALLEDAGAAGVLSPREDARGVVVVVRGVFEGRGVTVADRTGLEAVARLARAHAGYPLVVEGHSASGRNVLALSADRARAAVEALVALGVEGPRLRAVGLGARRPLAPEELTGARERNERLEIVFVRAAH